MMPECETFRAFMRRLFGISPPRLDEASAALSRSENLLGAAMIRREEIDTLAENIARERGRNSFAEMAEQLFKDGRRNRQRS